MSSVAIKPLHMKPAAMLLAVTRRLSVCALLVLTAGTTLAQDTAVERGEARFQHSCAPCHGRGPGDDGRAMLPGTDALRLKYQGALPPVLEDRTDLPVDVLQSYLRKGSMAMPPFRKTELSDAQIEDIAAYLQFSSRGQ